MNFVSFHVVVVGAFIVNFLVIGMINASSGILMTEFQAKYDSSSGHVMGVFGLLHTLRNLLGNHPSSFPTGISCLHRDGIMQIFRHIYTLEGMHKLTYLCT